MIIVTCSFIQQVVNEQLLYAGHHFEQHEYSGTKQILALRNSHSNGGNSQDVW